MNALIEKATQMVVMDAIEKGHTNKEELIHYMSSEVFENAVKRYLEMFKLEFQGE